MGVLTTFRGTIATALANVLPGRVSDDEPDAFAPPSIWVGRPSLTGPGDTMTTLTAEFPVMIVADGAPRASQDKADDLLVDVINALVSINCQLVSAAPMTVTGSADGTSSPFYAYEAVFTARV